MMGLLTTLYLFQLSWIEAHFIALLDFFKGFAVMHDLLVRCKRFTIAYIRITKEKLTIQRVTFYSITEKYACKGIRHILLQGQ